MNNISRKRFQLLTLLLAANGALYGAVGCTADGNTDATACLQTALNNARLWGNYQVNLSTGTYIVNATLIIPDEVQLIGCGRGDQGYIGTVLRAGPLFPLHNSVVEMGRAGVQNSGVVVKGMTIDGEGRADYILEDLNAGERSRGEDLQLTNFVKAGLHVASAGAAGAGPFKDLEIYPLEFSTPATNCIVVQNVPFFRGVYGATCNGSNTHTAQWRPAVALQTDGGGVYSDFHVESFVTAYQLGSPSTPADGAIIQNGQLGPNVDIGVTITSAPGNQNFSLFGISCYSCNTTLNDLVTGTSFFWPIGFYLEGGGLPITNRRIFTSDAQTSNNLGNHPVLSVGSGTANRTTQEAPLLRNHLQFPQNKVNR